MRAAPHQHISPASDDCGVCSVEVHDTELHDCAVQADLPPWILFSDFERAEWATQMLSERRPLVLPGIYSYQSLVLLNWGMLLSVCHRGYVWYPSCIHVWMPHCWGP
jgi:hypothetical protein